MKKKIIPGVLIAALLVIGVYLACHGEMVRVLIANWTAPALKMDQSEWTGGKSYEHLPYSEISEADYLDLYVPDGETAPLFVMVHGGGFFYNDSQSRQAQWMFRYFREHGYACASVNYRLSSEAGYPAPIEDVKSAVRFLRANAEKYGYNADKIIIWGESAGAYLAMMAALTDDTQFMGVPFIGEEELAEPVSAKVDVLVEYYGAVEFDREKEDYEAIGIPGWVIGMTKLGTMADLLAAGEGFGDFRSMFLKKEISECTPQELAEMNPLTHLRSNFGRDELTVMIYHGDADISVAWPQSERFCQACCEVLGEENVSLTIFPGMKHADDRMYTGEVLGEMCRKLDGLVK